LKRRGGRRNGVVDGEAAWQIRFELSVVGIEKIEKTGEKEEKADLYL
jgi:hypothetical protein